MQNSGFVDSVIAKYDVFPGSLLLTAKPYLDGSGEQIVFKGIGEKKAGLPRPEYQENGSRFNRRALSLGGMVRPTLTLFPSFILRYQKQTPV